MTWKSHCLANTVLAAALTHSPAAAAAAMLTATLPDQLETILPMGRHRGATHWLAVWLAVMIAVPFFAREYLERHPAWFAGDGTIWFPSAHLVAAGLYGLALGPLLHVLLDGCSDSGVPFAPFSRWKLCLGMYRTYDRRWRWDFSEALFMFLLFGGVALLWWIRRGSAHVM